jgi:serine/threonine protein kinase
MDEEPFLLSKGSIIRDPVGSTYVVEALLGQGGFGAVYLVREQHDKQRVFALKEEIHTNRYRRASFTVEADILSRLRHSALPRVYHVFEDVQRLRSYMLMEYIDGQNLDALRREQPEKRFPLPLALKHLAPIVEALIYLHQQDPPIVHRDIKPANIIVPTDHAAAVLVDFGIAKEYVEDRTTNAIRQATPGYAAPEQYGGGTTPRTDLYSLGATLYTMLTGQIPPHALRRAISRDADLLQPAHEIVLAVPEGVAQAIGRAMAIQSEDRFETVEQFWQELTSQATEQSGQIAPKDSPVTPLPLPAHRHRETLPASLPKEPHTRHVAGRSLLVVLVLILLLAVGWGAGAMVFGTLNLSAPGSTQRATPSPTASPPACGAPSAVTPVSTPTLGSPVYPNLASSYAGTIYDSLTKQQTTLCLMNIQQSQENIHGTLQGLGLAGTFQGTVTTNLQLSFTMPLYAGTEVLACKGAIKVGGDLTGTFKVYNQQGNFTGESGLWNVSVYV